MSNPKRIQRKRTKGWKMPPNTVYVGRPTKWGNPWNLNALPASLCVNNYRRGLLPESSEDYPLDITVEDVRRELCGKDLACWCPLDQPCHADVLLEIANAGVSA